MIGQLMKRLVAGSQGKITKFALLAEEETPQPTVTSAIKEPVEILQSLATTVLKLNT